MRVYFFVRIANFHPCQLKIQYKLKLIFLKLILITLSSAIRNFWGWLHLSSRRKFVLFTYKKLILVCRGVWGTKQLIYNLNINLLFTIMKKDSSFLCNSEMILIMYRFNFPENRMNFTDLFNKIAENLRNF